MSSIHKPKEDLVEYLRSGGVRRHPSESVRKPKGIRKDEDSVYAAVTSTTDPGLVAFEDLAQRVNAIELNMHTILRELHILTGKASVGIKLPTVYPDNVVPMRKAKGPTRPATQTVVPGNEAEVLDEDELPVVLPPPHEPALKLADTVPKLIPSLHGPGVHPKDTVRKLSQITDVSPDMVADIAWRHGMDMVELTDIAYEKYTERELDCYGRYNLSRDDVKFGRLVAQYRMDVRAGKNGPHVGIEPVIDGGFASWYRSTQQYVDYLTLVTNEKVAGIARTHTRTHPLLPGEAKARQRIFNHKKDAARLRIAVLLGSKGRRAKFREIVKVSKRLSHGASVTTSSQIAGLSSAYRALRDTLRSMFGMNPRKVGMRKLRLEYALEQRLEDPNDTPSLKLGHWTGGNWWSYNKDYTSELVPVWVPSWKTVRQTARSTERWHDPANADLERMLPRERMNFIGNRLVTLGLNDPLHVSAMQTHMLSLYGESLLHSDAIVVYQDHEEEKTSVLGMRGSQQYATDG